MTTPITPDGEVFDAAGRLILRHLVETAEALQGFESRFREAGIAALEEFYLRATGHDIDLREAVKATLSRTSAHPTEQ